MNIAVLLTCHNRRDKTLACLRALFGNVLPPHASIHVVMVDDGSTDGTAAAVAGEFPGVEILQGSGGLYWNRGMHMAFGHALKRGFDGYLWLNDDTELYPDSIMRLVASASDMYSETGVPCVIVGSTEDDDGRLSYGGSVTHSRLRRFRFYKVWNKDREVECEAMNGNCVLVPAQVADAVGNIDPVFEHAMGDVDYALRVRSKGMRVFAVRGFVGRCANNSLANTYMDPSLPLRKRWRLMTGAKGLPPASWYRLTRRHGGVLWPLHFAWPYLKQLVS